MTRIVFFGTPEEAVPVLATLTRDHDVRLVVTQPDRPRGRSGKPQPPPVKVHAEAAGIRVVQPSTRSDLSQALQETFDLGVVVAYGRILRPEVLHRPVHGLLNIHFSLLPRWRGAAPVARALMAGDPMSGVTIIRLDEGLDTGPVLSAQAVDIGVEENAGELTRRLALLGASLLARVIPPYLAGSLVPAPQSEEGATYADKLTPEDRILDHDADPEVFIGRVRGLSPTPGAVLTLDDEPTKILGARASEARPAVGTWRADGGPPVVSLGDGAVELTHVQSPGRKVQTGADWGRGRRRTSGHIGQPRTIR